MHAALAGRAGLAGIEVRARQSVSELAAGAAIIHFRLGSFNLELVQNAGQVGYLLLVQIQLVGQEAQRPANAPAAAESRLSFEWVVAVRHRTSSGATAVAVLVVMGMLVEEVVTEVAQAAPGTVAHVSLLLAGAIRSRRGLTAWAKCLTLTGILRMRPVPVNR
jgi:hypothetical protein